MPAIRRPVFGASLAALACLSLWPAALLAQAAKTDAAAAKSKKADGPGVHGPRLGEERTETYRFGVVISADKGACTGLLATTPIPMDWPEQSVAIVSEEKTSHVKRLEYKAFDGGVKQMRVSVPMLPAGAEAKALVTVKITRRVLIAPADPSQFELPEKIDAKLRGYLAASPYIESTDAKIQAAAREAAAAKDQAWERVAALYDWTRAHVKYQEGSLKGALQALKDGTGDCEELTSLFIALCRANKIPARTVWVPGHCYPEFYLVDKEGHGSWIPCQAAGGREFGGIGELRPILQKGDSFSLPEKPREKLRYVSEFATGKGQPSVRFIREAVK